MSSLPLHPALVHLPLGLAFILPALTVGFVVALWRRRVRPRAWMAIVALQAVLLGAGLAAMNTGEREEHRVERVVPEGALELHEEYAEQFVLATALTLLAAGLVLVARPAALGRGLMVTTIAGTLVVAGAAVRVGHAGGRLVYVHNAGAAYGAAAPDPSAERRALAGSPEHRNRDDRER